MGQVVIVIAKCISFRQNFGIRFENRNDHNEWVGTWAFPIKESVAKKEGYNKNVITGSFTFSSEYPGCPYCKSVGLIKCSCNNIGCWDGETDTITCPSCGKTSRIIGEIDSFQSGYDR
jgi:transposase-like protein